jgi:hypothetical protein
VLRDRPELRNSFVAQRLIGVIFENGLAAFSFVVDSRCGGGLPAQIQAASPPV